MPTLERVLEVKARVEDDLLRLPGVTGVDVGYQYSGGAHTGQLAIRVYVRRKKRSSELPPEEVIPRQIEGVPVDVIEATIVPHT